MRLSEAEFEALSRRRSPAPAVAAPAPPGGIRQSKGGRKRNKTETRFELEYLAPLLALGELRVARFEAVTLRLANGVSYTPDFWSIDRDDRTRFFEVKGPYIREDGKLKLKLAAESFNNYEFYLARRIDGEWMIERVWAN